MATSKVKVILIAAVGNDGVLGAGGVLPWRCPADLRHFRDLTIGKVCLMGRKTADSLPKPLRDRTNLVLTRGGVYPRPGFIAVRNMRDIRRVLRAAKTDELWVIGGGDVYRQYIKRADVVHLTQLDIDVPNGDTWFPMGDLARFNGATTHACVDPLVHFWVFTPKAQTTRARRGLAIEMALDEPVAIWAPDGMRVDADE